MERKQWTDKELCEIFSVTPEELTDATWLRGVLKDRLAQIEQDRDDAAKLRTPRLTAPPAESPAAPLFFRRRRGRLE